ALIPVLVIYLCESDKSHTRLAGFMLAGLSVYYFHTCKLIVAIYLGLYLFKNFRDYKKTIGLYLICFLIASPGVYNLVNDVEGDKIFSFIFALKDNDLSVKGISHRLASKEPNEFRRSIIKKISGAFGLGPINNDFVMGRWNYGAMPFLVWISVLSGSLLVYGFVKHRFRSIDLPEIFLVINLVVFFIAIVTTPFIEPRVLYLSGPWLFMLSGVLFSRFRGFWTVLVIFFLAYYCVSEVYLHNLYFNTSKLSGFRYNNNYYRWRVGLDEAARSLSLMKPKEVLVRRHHSMNNQLRFFKNAKFGGDYRISPLTRTNYIKRKKYEPGDIVVIMWKKQTHHKKYTVFKRTHFRLVKSINKNRPNNELLIWTNI
ncbi:hypothetical protein ACFLRF_02070, partial [Candidatus Altiarchaeota archaeon]